MSDELSVVEVFTKSQGLKRNTLETFFEMVDQRVSVSMNAKTHSLKKALQFKILRTFSCYVIHLIEKV